MTTGPVPAGHARPGEKVVVVGAGGFIGSALLSRLLGEGFQVTAVARHPLTIGDPALEWAEVDLVKATPATWASILPGASAAIYCAGLLQDEPGTRLQSIHVDAPTTLFKACADHGVRRAILLSAIGADRGAPSAFSSTKRAGETALMAMDLDWVILRPSVVLGRGAQGSGALIRGLAALPLRPVMPNAGAIQPVTLEDLVETVVRLLSPSAPGRIGLELAGPTAEPFDRVIDIHRAWLGWPAARKLRLAPALANIAYVCGDGLAFMGWRTPIRTIAKKEIQRGATGDPTAWTALTGIMPRPIEASLQQHVASLEDRQHARLYFLKPLVFAALAFFWLGTALISLGPGWRNGLALMETGGAGRWSAASVIGGALGDLATGCLIAFARTAKLGLALGLALSAFYAVAGTIIHAELWRDPLGPFWKILPIATLMIVAWALADQRR